MGRRKEPKVARRARREAAEKSFADPSEGNGESKPAEEVLTDAETALLQKIEQCMQTGRLDQIPMVLKSWKSVSFIHQMRSTVKDKNNLIRHLSEQLMEEQEKRLEAEEDHVAVLELNQSQQDQMELLKEELNSVLRENKELKAKLGDSTRAIAPTPCCE
eukprot:TRINITY_DN4853_c1_g1_i3.p2 TRINITY_DN4853_c1_g1~~TRINITY_DN4853_c1_g1_i3.p2  ORF type:complete len:160 (+),score=64.29 TRINITY_DN4853_c1_g1_i3:106-585(+)